MKAFTKIKIPKDQTRKQNENLSFHVKSLKKQTLERKKNFVGLNLLPQGYVLFLLCLININTIVFCSYVVS